MSQFVICAFRPKPGKEKELLAVVRDHMPTLRSQGLNTDRPAYVMQAKDGTLIEVFEWKSQAAVEQAHRNPFVRKLWDRFETCCDYVTLRDLAESAGAFPNFQPVDL